MNIGLAVVVESAAEARGDPPVMRDFITEALHQIELGYVIVERYPTGIPDLKAVYALARELERVSAK